MDGWGEGWEEGGMDGERGCWVRRGEGGWREGWKGGERGAHSTGGATTAPLPLLTPNSSQGQT